MKFSRRASTQDVSWFLDQARQKRLDLTPPYQRKSVWTSGDRRFFLDTIFRDYPCPPIYLHKTIDETGAAIYHIVDGKQRIETVINFANQNRIRLPKEFGDERLDNKRWKDIFQEPDLRNRFLNYVFSVEYFDDVDGTLVNEIFARMNKNSRKLTQQEVRNARFDGWFSKQVESEVENPIWRTFGVVTPGNPASGLTSSLAFHMHFATYEQWVATRSARRPISQSRTPLHAGVERENDDPSLSTQPPPALPYPPWLPAIGTTADPTIRF